jgi:hypothetical membrane protein
MNPKLPTSIRISALCGILGPILGIIFIAYAIYLSDWFYWTDNWLSDLGGIPGNESIYASRGIISIIFNSGLIISGIIGLIFSNALKKVKKLNNRLGCIGVNFFIIDMFALCAIGILPETTGYLHTIISVIFFILITLSLLFIGISFWKSSEKMLGRFVTILGAITLCSFPFFMIPQPWGSNAIIEMIPIVSISIFTFVFGTLIYIDEFTIITNKK